MSCTPPFGAFDLDMWRSFLNMETPYESARDLCSDAIDGRPTKFLVDFCLQLRINPKTRRQNSLNNFKEDWEDRGRKQWLRTLIPTIFMLYRILLQLSQPDNAWARLPQGTSRVSKRIRVQCAACGFMSRRQAPEATRVDTT